MPVLHHDFETRSTLNLRDGGAWRYSTCPTTDVWCCAYAADDGPVELWVPGDPVPQAFIEAASNQDWIVCAFNDQFERLITQHIMAPRYGWPMIPIERRRCLQASALAHALPGKLENTAPALGLGAAKDRPGHKTMMQMARPRKPRKGQDPSVSHWFDDEDRRLKLYAYCKQDVVVERAIHARIGFLSDEEQKLWELDATINARGIHIDRALLGNARNIAEQELREIDSEVARLTGGEITSINQNPRFPKWFAAQGHPIDNIQKETLEQALKRTDLTPLVHRVIELRLAGAHAAAAKHGSMTAWMNPDNRARGALRFHGASTGRWTSHGIQLQNMKRPLVEDMGAAIESVSTGSLEHMRKLYKQPMSVVGDISRAMIRAAPGHRFIAADLSGIESRVTAWLSGQQSKLDQWAKFDQTKNPEDEPYYVTGAETFGIPAIKARVVGKTGDLAFGYMGGVGAWRKMAKLVLPDDTSTDAEIKRRQQAWRDAHPQTVTFWNALSYRAVRTVQNPGTTVQCKRMSFNYDGSFLWMQLPSGRKLAYPFPKLGKNKFDKPTVVFMDSTKGKWVECRGGEGAYGGTWIENAVQAVARDLFAAAMQPLEDAGYTIVLHVHDEIVAEVADGFGSAEEFLKILTTAPSWADGLPIAAKVREGPRFCKMEKPKRTDPAEASPEQAEMPPHDTAEQPPADIAGDAPPFEDTMRDDFKGNGYASGENYHGRVEAEYVYKRPNGEPYLLVKRMKPKSFPQYHVNGTGQWENGAPKGPKIPYRLPELLQAPSQEPIFVCEGEKDADNVAELGLITTTNSEGAEGWTADLSQWFTGRQTVYVIEDNDDGGRRHTHDVIAGLQSVVSEIRIVSFPDVGEGEDVSDWLNTYGHSKTELLERCKGAPSASASATPDSLFDPWAEFDAPEFPIEVLPNVVQNAVLGIAGVTGADISAVTMTVICALSGAIDHRFALKMMRHGNWWAHPRLWVLLVGDPSTMKTPSMNAATEPLEQYQTELLQLYQLDLKAHLAAGGKPEDGPPMPPRLVTWDSTIEKLGDILSRSGRGLLVKRDEITGWIGSMERYNNRGSSADRAFWLQAYNGGRYIVDRVKRGETVIENLSTSVLGGIQPSRMAELQGLTSDGLLQRYIPVLMRASKLPQDAPSDDAAYTALTRSLIRLDPTHLFMTDEALARMNELQAHLHTMGLAADSLAEGLSAFILKLKGVAGNLAIILHLTADPDLRPTQSVEMGTVDAVERIIRGFILPHAVEFYRMAINDHERLRRLASFIITSGKARIVASDLTTNIREMRGLTVRDVNDRVSPLVAGGWMMPEGKVSFSNHAWRVQPAVATLFAGRRKSEELRKKGIADAIAKEAEARQNRSAKRKS